MNPAEGWGRIIEDTINVGREDKSSSFKRIESRDARFKDFDHSSHVMIYSRTPAVGVLNFPLKAIILMQMKFDGSIGFPGGFVDEHETPLEAVRRELREEVAWRGAEETISDGDYLFSHVDETKEVAMHFFATEVCEKKIKEIEKSVTLSATFGTEVLGIFRIPLYVMGDSFRGFPCFLRNQFFGNSKLQLIEAIITLKLLNEEQMIQALYSSPHLTD